ncbi:hypothetical protein FOXG_21383 [Fusarium oxysporum f. sp. lycopersici 4287]|uniref:Uncharacterized protein n=1 Tax=Fusarium oxysporum f. sp. lycopersici (strain 4287 / CBS 123668 / FGSC 9935 / NRRL 34936) TaxID=426428 RepID=A0A0J9VXS9_FUSO4|nr:hypothetical protein FOXG_21383 [Fusarium oxysporum f. sp. lycopersici 4287]KNB15571.1 hypothetical protein FOXG_21383 [Fusarium oxysporum f. sp. lycopersici 4287]
MTSLVRAHGALVGSRRKALHHLIMKLYKRKHQYGPQYLPSTQTPAPS